MAPRGKNLPLPKPASCSPLPTICGPACCTSCFPEETVLLGTSTRSLTEASVGALGWQMHAAFPRTHLRHSLNLLAPNSARKGGAISCAPSNPMTSHLFMHLTFLSRPHAHWGQAGTSSVWFVRQSLVPVSYRHQINVQWRVWGEMWLLSTPVLCQTACEVFPWSHAAHITAPGEVGFNIPNSQVRIEIIIK